jgi:hypothetical protein
MGTTDDIVSNLKNGVTNLGQLIQVIRSIFPQQVGTTATTATSGAASALPATPAGYMNVNLNGVTVKVPFYNT